MVMFLTILLTSFAVLAVMCIMVAGISPTERKSAEVRPEVRPDLRPDERLVLQSPQFFAAEVTEKAARPRVPLEVLMSQLQSHVRLEQAAAETFVSLPTSESLHTRTTSPFVN